MELKKIKQITPDPQYVQGHSWPLCHSCGEAGEQLGWAWGLAPSSSHGPLSDSDCGGRKSLLPRGQTLGWPPGRCLLLGGAGLARSAPTGRKSCLTAPRVGNDQLGVEDQSQEQPQSPPEKGDGPRAGRVFSREERVCSADSGGRTPQCSLLIKLVLLSS